MDSKKTEMIRPTANSASSGNDLSRAAPEMSDSSSDNMTDEDVSMATTSAAIECSSMGCPAEVVVEGQQMQSVCVRFIPPHPPSGRSSRDRGRLTSEPTYIRLVGHRVRSSHRDKRRDLAEVSRHSVEETEKLPYSHEVSSTSPVPSFKSLSASSDSLAKRGTSATGRDLDRRVRLDIENGVTYLERRNEELHEANEALERHLERLRGRMEEYEVKMAALESENTELKIQLDQLQTEKSNLHEQYVQEWRQRVKSDEDLITLRASTDRQIGSLRDELQQRTHTELQTDDKTHSSIGPAAVTSEDLKKATDDEEIKLLRNLVQELQLEKSRLETENVAYKNAPHPTRHRGQTPSRRDPGTPRSSRVDSNQKRIPIDCRLESTFPGKKDIGKIQLAFLDEVHLVRDAAAAANRKSSLLVEPLPPINVTDTSSVGRRQWTNATSVSGLN